jgi:hypothetical protein
MLIREEKPADHDAITEVTTAALATLEISGHTDQFIVKALRNAGALTISLVAEIDEMVLPGVPPEVFVVLSFDGVVPRRTIGFHEAFMATS